MSEVEAYIKSIHELIIKLYTCASVDISYRMPTCRIGDAWVALANQKQYISLYTCGAFHLESCKRIYQQQ